MNVRFAGQQDKRAWDAYINRHPNAAPYSLYAWKEAVEEAYGHNGCYLLAEEGTKILGVLPLVQFHVPFRSHNLISLPYCDVGDVLAETPEIRRFLIKEALVLAGRRKIGRVDIRSSAKNLIDTDLGWHVSVQSDKVRMLLDLPGSSEELWQGFKSKLRSQIKKAEKNGLSFRWGTRADISDFYRVFSRNMHALGSPVHSKKWIESVYKFYGGNARIGLVYKDTVPVGCGMILWAGKRVSIPWASTLREFNRLSPNMLLYWNFLQFAADAGKQLFDFGRSTPGEGTFRFKKQWGATPEPLYWHCLTKVERDQERGKYGASRRDRFALLWSKMPLFVANALGPKIRRFISL